MLLGSRARLEVARTASLLSNTDVLGTGRCSNPPSASKGEYFAAAASSAAATDFALRRRLRSSDAAASNAVSCSLDSAPGLELGLTALQALAAALHLGKLTRVILHAKMSKICIGLPCRAAAVLPYG